MKTATGIVIRAFRRHLNYKQEYVAKKLNVTAATIANIEHGRVSVDIEKLYQLSIIFGIPLKDMVALASEVFEKGPEEGLNCIVDYLQFEDTKTP